MAKKEYNDIDLFGQFKVSGIEDFGGCYMKKSFGPTSQGTSYAALDAMYKDGTYHRVWKLSFPSGVNFWGKIKITISGNYSSFNASGVMSKVINCNFNTSSLYNNVGFYTDLGLLVETDFRISEAIWNSTTSCWEIWIVSKQLQGNNNITSTIVEAWAFSDTLLTAAKGITYTNSAVAILDNSASYTALKANYDGSSKIVLWTTNPIYEDPYGFKVWTSGNLSKSEFSNASDSFNFDANIEPTQTGTSAKTHLWSIQYALQGMKYVYTLLKGLLSTGGRVKLDKMQNRAPYINGNPIIGSETDTLVNWVAGTNITITPGTPTGGLLPVTISAAGGSGGSQTQVDFNITDTANVGFILNKPIENRTISSRISALINKRLQVNPGTAAGSYNEGLRIANSSQGYSLVALGCDSSTDSGLNSDGNQWHVIKYPNGDLAIVKNSSDTSQGLFLDFDGNVYWKGNKLLYGSLIRTSFNPTNATYHLIDSYNLIDINSSVSNKDFTINLDETQNIQIELSVQMTKQTPSAYSFVFAGANGGNVYFDKAYTDITTVSGDSLVHYVCRYINGNWFVSNQVFEM